MEFENFRVIKSLGVGATSEVFEAVNLETDKPVALKVFSPLVAHDAETLARLEEEFEILKKLRHTNIVTPVSRQKNSQFYGLELELVRGSDLKTWAQQMKFPLLEPRLWVLSQIARGLGAAHELDILHRDLKPENIIVSNDGDVKITDFGLARSISRVTMTRSGLLVGSLGYMAPEVINGEKAAVKSDLFSYAIIAYELLCGTHPFGSSTPQGLIRAITEGKFIPLRERNPLVPAKIAELIEFALSVDPKMRPDGIWNFEAVLMNCLSRSRLLPMCRGLVSSERDQLLAGAYEAKHKSLGQEIEQVRGEIEKEKNNLELRRCLVALYAEMNGLFPESPLTTEALVPISRGSRLVISKWVVAVLIVSGILVGTGAFVFKKSRSNASVGETQSPAAQSAALAQQENPVPAKARQKFGRVRFDLDPDVEIFVDDKFVPKENWNGLRITAGRHRVKMIKPGFLPIENQLVIVEGKTSIIRARGNP